MTQQYTKSLFNLIMKLEKANQDWPFIATLRKEYASFVGQPLPNRRKIFRHKLDRKEWKPIVTFKK